MGNERLLSVDRFAQLGRTTRDTLHHYDKIGLLTPEERGKNNYRYYACKQVAQLSMIRILQAGGMPLAEIKEVMGQSDPKQVCANLKRQISQLEIMEEELKRSQKLLATLHAIIRSAEDADEDVPTIRSLPEAKIVLGELNDYSNNKNPFDALSAFYAAVGEKYPELDLNYPVWGLFSEERKGEWGYAWPDRFYFFNPDGQDTRPAARYAIGYTHGNYCGSGALFTRLLGYMEAKGLRPCGNAYEEYPLHAIGTSDRVRQLIRVMIPVCEK